MIHKGGLVSNITVGDCIELTAALKGTPLPRQRGPAAVVRPTQGDRRAPGQRTTAAAGASHRGPRSIEQIVDGYGIECRAVRDLLVEYFTERAPELDHVSLRSIARNVCRLFWRDLEIHHPGIDSLRLPREVAQAWKEHLAHMRNAEGHPVRPRVNFRSELVFVRAFY
ncbi:hypothetical protein [Streptomyces sp. ME19-01-6]|uniref:hypothetical protein n=1 Tax=Streptomyces sp. ME19-01-6 TaxID=3028686 RepID=UPI0029BB0552|nr:hypothetical protein [Streptomyces sp. ME19-01-6]MDX3225094.1 hypothetical protein [Streptomyces sp. ME19-01-6]